jgi:LmbE family N-acetylglucosaminyl deacetylase
MIPPRLSLDKTEKHVRRPVKLTDNAGEIAVIVAHPDDEVLWCGGYILMNPEYRWRIITLSRAGDPDRAPKFRRVLQHLRAYGEMGQLDDGPEQKPLPAREVQDAIVQLLQPMRHFHMILTHGPRGEYTSHRRHEECCMAVVGLWRAKRIFTDNLWCFAYEDGDGTYLPRPRTDADWKAELTKELWIEKRRMITELYEFSEDSWEARAVPREEAFWCFTSASLATDRIAEMERVS